MSNRRGDRAPGPRLQRSLLRDQGGAIAAETAIFVVVMMVIFLHGVELARFVLLNQKLDRVAMSVADLVSRGSSVTNAEVDDIMTAASLLSHPYGFAENGTVIVSAIRRGTNDQAAMVAWQRQGGGTMEAQSSIGAIGAVASVDPEFQPRKNENVYISEVFWELSG